LEEDAKDPRTMELFYILLVVLLVTRIFAELAVRFHQPPLAGELVAGVLLGVVVSSYDRFFPILSELSHNRVFDAITDLGIFFLMLLAGLEMRLSDIIDECRSSLFVAVGGMVFPMALGLGLGYFALPQSDWKLAQMLYIGVALSVTAVPITAATLMDLGKQRSRVGRTIISAAVFSDLLGLLLLAVLTSLLDSTVGVTADVLLFLIGKFLAFFVVSGLIGKYVFPLVGGLATRLHIKHAEFSMLLTWGLAFSVLAEFLDMHFILGAYAAGLFFTRRTIDETIHQELFHKVETITLGFFAPVFFASIGLSIRLEAVTETPVFLVLLIVAAFLGKMMGAGLGAICCRIPRRESLAIGVGMNARGAVELVIAGIALRAGLFDHPVPTPPVVENLFSAVVIMAIVAAITSPIGLRALLSRGQQSMSDDGCSMEEKPVG
jgi:Kef-type K+ transport system membrane component KefB